MAGTELYHRVGPHEPTGTRSLFILVQFLLHLPNLITQMFYTFPSCGELFMLIVDKWLAVLACAIQCFS